MRNSDSCLYYGFHSKSALQVWSLIIIIIIIIIIILRHSSLIIIMIMITIIRAEWCGASCAMLRLLGRRPHAPVTALGSRRSLWSGRTDGMGLAHCLSLAPAHS